LERRSPNMVSWPTYVLSCAITNISRCVVDVKLFAYDAVITLMMRAEAAVFAEEALLHVGCELSLSSI
jgi:hypothetical protein